MLSDIFKKLVDTINYIKGRLQREKERTMLIDILANGSLSPDTDRYLIKDEE